MTFHSLPLSVRTLKATEARLEAIYDAAYLGLQGDSLALKAGLLPVEFGHLQALDPMVDLVVQKARADAEAFYAGTLHAAAAAGDAKAALEVLKHQHGWTAKTAVDVNVNETISITAALRLAETRVIEGLALDRTEAQPALAAE